MSRRQRLLIQLINQLQILQIYKKSNPRVVHTQMVVNPHNIAEIDIII